MQVREPLNGDRATTASQHQCAGEQHEQSRVLGECTFAERCATVSVQNQASPPHASFRMEREYIYAISLVCMALEWPREAQNEKNQDDLL